MPATISTTCNVAQAKSSPQPNAPAPCPPIHSNIGDLERSIEHLTNLTQVLLSRLTCVSRDGADIWDLPTDASEKTPREGDWSPVARDIDRCCAGVRFVSEKLQYQIDRLEV